ncbi:response regulator [uncultured Desulfuromusa sp.]|uniref:response regulator n=1 Tax=uncultured Desulfuromusa sp. TaxID=219183 RepID=UPI002AA60DEB|nr:response regulator [uncultured Desulfuromusa sp.]
MKQVGPKILFIDKEQSTLELLRQLLRDEEWDCQFVTSASEAMALLENQPIDLIVSDAQTSEMNGFQLLAKVYKQYPSVVRLVISGYSQQDNIIKTLAEGYPQQIIPKPWVDQEFKEIIRSALRQSSLQKKQSPEFQALINSTSLLPALPESYSNIRSCIVGDEVNIEKMADFISQDIAISGALLHWANSALFGQRFLVDTIKKAIIVLGTDIVENLILSEAVIQAIAQTLPNIEGFDFNKLKTHSMATAVLSRLLIKSIFPTDSNQQDRAFVAGLLHDLGKLATASFFPAQFEKAITLANTRKCPLQEAEIEVYGTQHAELGGFLAEWWAFPPFIVNAILWHHQPQTTPMDKDVIAAAHVANLLSYQFNYGSNGETYPRRIADGYREKFYLTEEENEFLRSETEKTVGALTS